MPTGAPCEPRRAGAARDSCTRRRPRGLRLGALGLLLIAGCVAVGSCVAVDEGRPGRERRAEAATRRADWLLAGTLWYRLYEEDAGANARAGRETARALFEQGDGPGALRIAASVLARYPDETELYILTAEIHSAHGSSAAAVTSLEHALALDPDRMDVLAQLGEARFTAGLWDRAVGPLRRAAAAGVRPRELTWLAALAAERSGDLAGAFADYRTALRSNASTAEELLCAARLADDPVIRATEPLALAVSIDWLERACDFDPQQVEAHYRLGRAYRESGRREPALLRLRRAAEIDPTSVDTLMELASLYAEADDATRALEFSGRALALDPPRAQQLALEALVRSVQADSEEPSSEAEAPDGG